MEKTLFHKVLDDLVEHNYEGILMLNANCEPFLDKRMPELIDEATKNYQMLSIFYFNGTLITQEILEKLQESWMSYISIIILKI